MLLPPKQKKKKESQGFKICGIWIILFFKGDPLNDSFYLID
jgi:hypothetical protein